MNRPTPSGPRGIGVEWRRHAVPRYTLTRREAVSPLGISINHFERKVQPELKVALSGQLVLIAVAELERWIQSHAHRLVELPARDEAA